MVPLRGLKPHQSYFNVKAIKNYKTLGGTVFESHIKGAQRFLQVEKCFSALRVCSDDTEIP